MAGAPSCMKIVHSCTFMWSCNLFFSNSRYFAPFMVVPGVRRKSPAVSLTDMALHIMIFGECFIVCCVYFSSNRFPTSHQTECFRDPNCWMHDSSEKITLDHCSLDQLICFFTKFNLFNLIAGVWPRVFLAGLNALRPKSFVKRRFTVLLETSVPCANNAERIFLNELRGERTATRLMRRSYLAVVFRGLPDLLLSE